MSIGGHAIGEESSAVRSLPPLECLRFFDAAARHQNFVRASEELGITAAAVAYRVKTFEEYLGHPLFDRHPRGVRLNPRGRAFLGEVQRLLAQVREVMGRYGDRPRMRRLRVVAVESVAERWLMPKLAGFRASWPELSLELETDVHGVDPNRHDFDIWITYEDEGRAPSAETTRRETLFEETLFPVCSPSLLEIHGRPRSSLELHSWPLLHHLARPSDWTRWFACQGDPQPDLSRASGFRLHSMLVQGAVEGMGVAVGRPAVIARELGEGTLVPLLHDQNEMRTRCLLITTAAARRKREVQGFREWVLQMAASERLVPTVSNVAGSGPPPPGAPAAAGGELGVGPGGHGDLAFRDRVGGERRLPIPAGGVSPGGRRRLASNRRRGYRTHPLRATGFAGAPNPVGGNGGASGMPSNPQAPNSVFAGCGDPGGSGDGLG